MKAYSLKYHDIVDARNHVASGFPSPDAALSKLTEEQFGYHLRLLYSYKKTKPVLVTDFPVTETTTEPIWMMTFDGGGGSAYTTIAGMLEDLGWRGHFMIATDYIGSKSFMNSSQIVELHERGHVIGTNTCSHPLRIVDFKWEKVLNEWKNSTELLSDLIGEQVRVGSIPGRKFSRHVAEAASEAGLNMLFSSVPTSTVSMVERCMLFGRYSISSSTSPESALGYAAGSFLPCLRQSMLWNSKKLFGF